LKNTFEKSDNKMTELPQNFFILVVFIFLEFRQSRHYAVWMLFEQMLSEKSKVLECSLDDPLLSIGKFGCFNRKSWIRIWSQALE